jgi:hypothetical protein
MELASTLKRTLAFLVEQMLLFWPPYRVEDEGGDSWNA